MNSQVERLEAGLLLALETLQTLIDRLEGKFGEDLFTNSTKSPSVLRAEQEAEQAVKRFDDLIAQGQESTVVTEFHAMFAMTWDQAHSVYREWNKLSQQQKQRRVQIAQWLAKVSAVEGNR
jgi:hypothetical protein